MSWNEHSDAIQFDCLLQDVSSDINGVNWSNDGTQLLVSTDDDSVIHCSLESPQSSWSARTSYSRKHGAAQTQFIMNSNNICLALSKFSKDLNSSARLWDIKENRFLKVVAFNGKVVRGNGMTVHTERPWFLVTTLDGRAYLQHTDTNKPSATYTANLLPDDPSQSIWHRSFLPVTAFERDPESTGFAIATDPLVIRLFDLRHISAGEYLSIPLSSHLNDTDWIRSINFTPRTKDLLITSAEGKMILVDGSDGSLLTKFEPPPSTTTNSLLADRNSRPYCSNIVTSLEFHTLGFGFPDIPSDESVVALGTWDPVAQAGRINLWNLEDGKLCGTFGTFYDIPNFIKFHPTRSQLIVGDIISSSWLLSSRQLFPRNKRHHQYKSPLR